MRRLLVLVVAAAFVFGITAFAAGEQTQPAVKAEHAKGTITAWDEATRTLKLKDKAGKEWAYEWNDKTVVLGKGKVGEPVKVSYTKEKDGKMLATHIWAGKAEIDKAKAAKPKAAGTK